MKKFIFIPISVFCFLCACEKTQNEPCGIKERDNNAPQKLKVLVVGNSGSSNIPGILKDIAKYSIDTLIISQATNGGYNFKSHLADASSMSTIKSDKWDYVFLQESGRRFSLPDSVIKIKTYPYADTLISIIKSKNQSAKIFFYLTSPSSYGAENCETDSSWCTFDGMLKRMLEVNQIMVDKHHAELLPVGVVWHIFMDKYPEIDLYASDRGHANDIGSYLDACCFYSAIFCKKPLNIFIPKEVKKADAELVQKTVVDVLFDCNPNWRSYH